MPLSSTLFKGITLFEGFIFFGGIRFFGGIICLLQGRINDEGFLALLQGDKGVHGSGVRIWIWI